MGVTGTPWSVVHFSLETASRTDLASNMKFGYTILHPCVTAAMLPKKISQLFPN